MGSPVKMNTEFNSNNPIAIQNFETIKKFFSLYLESKDEFYSLWVEDNPIVYLPFPANDVSVARQDKLEGWEEVKSFWDPIFNSKGKFDWKINEVIVGEDPNIIVTKSNSDIEMQTGKEFNNVYLRYEGTYIQIFKFEEGKVKSFEEVYDTEFLNKQYTDKE